MSGLQRAFLAAVVIFGAGGIGFLVYRLSANDRNPSLEERINAAAEQASDTPRHSTSDPSAAQTAVRSAAQVLAGSDRSDPPVSAPRSAAPPVPTTVPTLSLPDVEGKSHSTAEWQGRPLLINFWATWCGPCLREIPLLRKVRAEHAKDGLEIVGIAIDFHDAVETFVRKEKIDYPILVAEENATAPRAFGVGMGLPTTVVANREGRIVATHVGELRAEQAQELVRLALKSP